MGNASRKAPWRGAPGLAVAMALACIGAMGPAQAGPDEEWDRVLRERILSRLLGQVSIDSRDIRDLRVEVKDGQVLLEGQVESLRDAETIGRLAWGYVEVRGVDNRITVRESKRWDMAVQQEVWDLLNRHAMLRWPAVTVTVDGGVVVLSGLVQEAVDRTVATLETATVTGVRGIQNQLEIEAIGGGRPIASQVYSLLRNPFAFGRVHELGVEETEDGSIRLLGYVWREADRIEAERLAGTVAGVEHVINQIELDLPTDATVQEGDSTVQ